MGNNILLKKSSVTGKIPLTTDLQYGEIAINYADGKLYYKSNAGSVGILNPTESDNFKTIAVSGQSNVVADNPTATLTLSPSVGIDITTNATTDTITFAHSDTSTVGNISSDNGAGVVIQDVSLTFDTFGHVTAASVGTVNLDSRYLQAEVDTLNTVTTRGATTSNAITVGGLTVNGNATITGDISGADSFTFDVTATEADGIAKVYWNNSLGVLRVGLNGGNVAVDVPKTQVAFVTNVETTTLNKGEVVYLFGAQDDRPTVKRASNTSDTTSSRTFGVVAEAITANGTGYIITSGVCEGLSLGAYTPGDILWLGSSAGTFTTTKPVAPAHGVFIGVVQRANNGNGQLYVKIQNGYELDEIHDVLISSVATNDSLFYDGAASVWKNTPPATARTNLGLGTIATQNANSVTITGGTINSTSVGATTPSTGAFTTLSTTGNATIGGNLTVQGTTTTISATNLAISDNMIYLNNGATNTNPDIGFAANYNDGSYRHAGFFRDATDGYWKVFKNYTPEPDASIYIDTSHASFALADIQAANFRGALVGNVSGNLSITGGTLTLEGSSPTIITDASSRQLTISSPGSNGRMNFLAGGVDWLGASGQAYYGVYIGGNGANNQLTINQSTSSATFGSGLVTTISNTTASSSASTGALVVSGGLGVAGSTNIGGNLIVGTGSSQISVSGSYGSYTYVTGGNINMQVSASGNAFYGLLPGAGANSAEIFKTNTQTTNGNDHFAFYQNGVKAGAIGVAGAATTGVYGSGIWNFTNNTASTSYSTGAVIVTGGLGVAGSIFTGGNLNAQGTISATQLLLGSNPSNDTGSTIRLTSGASISARNSGNTGDLYVIRQSDSLITLADGFRNVAVANNLAINGTTASTSWNNGALTVAGGLGVGGQITGSLTTSARSAFLVDNTQSLVQDGTYAIALNPNILPNNNLAVLNAMRIAPAFSGSTAANFRAIGIYATDTSSIANQIRGIDINLSPVTNTSINLLRGLDVTVASGSNRYSIYSGGTADSYFAGNVGIGTSSPAGTLDVRATAGGTILVGNSSGLGIFSADGGGTALGSFSNHKLFFRTNNTSQGAIDTSGNFGIGTTSPTAKLHVQGSAPEIYLEHTGGYDLTLTTSDGSGYNGISSSGPLSIGYNGQNTIMQRAGGNVGIGTTSPNEKLSIAYADNSYARIEFRSASYARQAIIEGVDDNSGGNGHLAFYTRNGGSVYERVRIASGGNVGIATTAPEAPLHIVGGYDTNNPNSLVISGRESAGNVYTGVQFERSGGGTFFGIGADARSDRDEIVIGGAFGSVINATAIRFYTGTLGGTIGTERLSIISSGNVGIGTASPGGTYGKLTVAGGIRTTDDTSSKLELGRYSSGAPNSYIKLGANSNALFITNAADSVDIFTILNSGNVGIGTTSPSQPLHVSGNARITGALYDSANSAGTSGQVLTSTGTGTAWSSTGAAVTGTGTTNYVAKFTGSTALGNSSIFDDGTNIGIGTASPTVKLHVAGNAKIGANGQRISLYDDGNAHIHSTDSILWINSETNTDVRINNQYNGNVILTNGVGSVGIGTSSPSERLDVTGNIKASGTIEAGGNITYGTNQVFSSSTITTTATTANQVVTAVSSTTYRTAKFIIQATDATGGKYQSQEILAVHNGSTVAHTEYTAINVGGAVATYDVDISGGTLRLLCTPLSANSTVFKVQMILIKS